MKTFIQYSEGMSMHDQSVAFAAWNQACENQQEKILMLISVINGCRGMAEVEIANGSKVWLKAIKLIDDVLANREIAV